MQQVLKPKVGIIITHYNYSAKVEGAIDSIFSQTYDNFEVAIVDDCSKQGEKDRLAEILSRKSEKLKAIWLEKNSGQLMAFYAGVQAIDADFYCLLDPDDEYLPTYLEEMVHLHLHPQIFVSMICCNQIYTVNGRQVTGTNLREKYNQPIEVKKTVPHVAEYFDWNDEKWPWTSTSSMMFRGDAVRMMYPKYATDIKICADTYLAAGCQYMGGTVVYNKPLVLRGIHEENAYQQSSLISQYMSTLHSDKEDSLIELRALAFANILENGGMKFFRKKHFKQIALRVFSYKKIKEMRSRFPKVKELIKFRHMITRLLGNGNK